MIGSDRLPCGRVLRSVGAPLLLDEADTGHAEEKSGDDGVDHQPVVDRGLDADRGWLAAA